MYAKIRRMFYREHLSINEIQRRTSLSRNTIKKWLKAPGDGAVKYQRAKKPGKLTPFESRLLLALEADVRRPRKDRRTAKILFQEIRKDGYAGGYTIVCDFVRNWRNQGSQSKAAYVPLKFALGEAFQFDWSEEWLVIGGIHRKVLAAHTKLCASRAFMLSGYPSQNHEMLFDAHTRAFAAFGGVPKRGIYDNMKTAVDKVSKGNGRVVNTRFFAMTAHYLFDPDFCNVASGWEKGVVEKNVQDMRRRIWNEAKQQPFSSFDDLNHWLEVRCRALWSEIQHPDYTGITLADALEQEQLYLMPMPDPSMVISRYWRVFPAHVWSHYCATVIPFPAVWPIRWWPLISMPIISRSFMTMPWQPVIPVFWIAIRSAMTGSTIFRSSRRSRALCATAHRLQNYQRPC